MNHVANDAIVTNDRGALGCGVQHTVVLHAGASSDGDVPLVAAQHRARPHGAVRADVNIADDDRVGVHKGVGMDVGNEVAEGINGHDVRVPIRHDVKRSAVQQIPWTPMSRRIEIELTSARPDGTWTWRAAGAQKPKGVLDGTLLPEGAAIGMILKADAETEMDGTSILSVSQGKAKAEKAGVLEMIGSDKPFEAVIETKARRDRSDRPGGDRDRGDRPRRDNDRPGGPRRDRPAGGPGGDRDRGPRPAGDRPSGPRTDRGPRPGGDRPQGRPHFEAPPELPQRPKAKRLKPGRKHRSAVLAELPEAQRAVAERVLQGGLPAVRQAVNEQNARLKSEGKEEIPAAGLLAIAEQLQPKLRVAEWLDRADAALADLEELDLRDLRSVVASGEDPIVARDETTREISTKLKEALVTKQDKELALWFGDIDAAMGVGRVVRALKLSSQPPKAGVRFPADLAAKLAASATGNLTADAMPDRWAAVLEAVAFSPIRALVQPTEKPAQVNDELLATVKRVGPLLPQIAALFGVDVDAKAQPKPLRPTRPTAPAKKLPPRPPAPPTAKATPKPAAAEVTEALVEVAAEAVEAPADAVVEADEATADDVAEAVDSEEKTAQPVPSAPDEIKEEEKGAPTKPRSPFKETDNASAEDPVKAEPISDDNSTE